MRGDFVARVTDIQRCGSLWVCPMCAPVIRERKAQDIEAGLSPFLGLERSEGRNAPQPSGVEARGSGLFVTLTTQHFEADTLAPRLDVVSRAMGLCLSGEPWKRRAARLGYVGLIRSLEVTYGLRHGWHPHVHGVLLFERELTDVEVAEFRDWLYGRWSGVLRKRKLGMITKRYGVDVGRVVAAEGLSSYMAKVEDRWGVGLELARADLKAARWGSRKPIEILADFAETGESSQLALWLEYEAATFGKQAIVWSRGLRSRLDLREEKSDVQLAASEGDGEGEVVLRVLVPAAVWNRHVNAGTQGDLLTLIEGMARDGERGVLRWEERP
jgi:hypothetical protein